MTDAADRLAKLSGTMAGYSRQAYAALCRHDYAECRVMLEAGLDAYDRDRADTLKRIRAMTLERKEEVGE